jgi:hypothetical protein
MITAGAGVLIPGRIPWTALDRWARRHDIGGFDFDFLVRAIAAMDAVLIAHSSKGSP